MIYELFITPASDREYIKLHLCGNEDSYCPCPVEFSRKWCSAEKGNSNHILCDDNVQFRNIVNYSTYRAEWPIITVTS